MSYRAIKLFSTHLIVLTDLNYRVRARTLADKRTHLKAS